ncbi:Stromal cell-derived factor 2-like protein [Smittium mucronatum]|uniref:Stromal cell-derived factor 2-like protein n=1 Tax=Smittium mucronatum TaxID=133383 RepID=A0A1R0H1S0_9FUNG|nr:Stromal cell-derived factor 2-like protein [Smittium mucronatum]
MDYNGDNWAPSASVYGQTPRPINSSRHNLDQDYRDSLNHQAVHEVGQGRPPYPKGYNPRPNLNQINLPNPEAHQSFGNINYQGYEDPRPDNSYSNLSSAFQPRPRPISNYPGTQSGSMTNQSLPTMHFQNSNSQQVQPGFIQPSGHTSYNVEMDSNVHISGYQQNLVSSGDYTQDEIVKSKKKGENKKWMGLAVGSAIGIGAATAIGAGIYAMTKGDHKVQDSPGQQQGNSSNDGDDYNCYSNDSHTHNDKFSSFTTSNGSATPREYPMLRQNANDPEIRIGTVVALKHNMTGRFLHSDSSKISLSGSNQQMVYCHRWNISENDWWQVIPANHDVVPPGQKVTYGSVIRLLHVSSSRHLHSHTNFFCPKTKQNEATCFGDLDYSDSNDHWVVERYGSDKKHGEIWKSNEVVVFRHQQTGLTLHSHDILYSEDVQSVTAFGDGHEENDKWRVFLTQH